MTSDRLLVRLVGLTVCLLALGAGAVLGIGELQGIDTPLTERLVFLLAGGLLGALTTRLTGREPVEVTTAPGDTVAVTPEPAFVDDEPATPTTLPPPEVIVTLDGRERAGYAVGWREDEVWVCWADPGLDGSAWVPADTVRRVEGP